jgi:hypothetical protein
MSYDYLSYEPMNAKRSSGLHGEQLEEAGNGDYDAEEDQFLRSRSFRGEAPEPADERTNSMGSQYTRNSFGNWVPRPNEMMKWMNDNPDPMPMHRQARTINRFGPLTFGSASSASGQLGSGEARRSDKVLGQYWSTFGERSKAAGGGVLGFMKSLFGRGMKRANQARYGS